MIDVHFKINLISGDSEVVLDTLINLFLSVKYCRILETSSQFSILYRKTTHLLLNVINFATGCHKNLPISIII
jgi:hypothetical protein